MNEHRKGKAPKSMAFRHFLARLPGFEPGAFRLGGGPSILLRYKRTPYETRIGRSLPVLAGKTVE